jgi:Holliday junction resolvasome RuvABC endonuclease subunit
VILALDPGLARIGYNLAHLWANPGGPPDVEIFQADVWRADLPEAEERTLPAVEDSFRRARLQGQRLRAVVREHGVSLVVTEALSHPRDAGSAAKVSMFWGVLGAVADELFLDVVMVRPQDARRVLGLPKTPRGATRAQKKRVVHDELRRRYGAQKLAALVGHLSRAEDRTHPLDGLATLTAALLLEFGEGVVIR